MKSAAAGVKASCAVRPERIEIAPSPAASSASPENRLKGRIAKRIFAGISSTYFVDRDGGTIKVVVLNSGQNRLGEGQDVVLSWSPESTVLIGS
jgi:putative spermidine/putrescine transport system ATP-binding protein/spermidine/putrescine transport system ATP-binding protein